MTRSLPGSATLNRIPSLDGLRAVSILMVVALHTLQRYGESHTVSPAWYVLANGQEGVFIFFEISGFLITALLLKEDERRGSVSLRGFYLRRVFRILPPLYLYIGTVVLLGAAGLLPVAKIDVVGAALFFHNVINGPTWALEHLWSISIEEQFYLVWPFVLVLALRTRGVAGRMKAVIFPATVIVLSPPARMLLNHSHNAALRAVSVSCLKFDFIMYGCAVALLVHTPRFERVYRAATRLWWLPPLVILGCDALSTLYKNYFDLTIGYTINGFAIVMFLLWCTRNADSVVGRFLNSWGMAKIGVLSYSIYLWQTLFLHDGNEAVFRAAPWLGRFPGNWLGFLLAATASYYIVEQPSLRARDWLIGRLRLYRAARVQAQTG
jgi:peptidoglycan/LPS O-acetylase OafA/YrhL